MRSVCESKKQLATFLASIDIASNIQCASDMLLFEPANESAALLKAWLEYRGIPAKQLTDHELVTTSIVDMRIRGNQPSFAGFHRFDPGIASAQFLKMWLSWFGVTSIQREPHEWWATKTRAVQKQLSTRDPLNTKKNALQLLEKLQRLQNCIRYSHQFYVGFNEATQQLTPKQITALKAPTVPVSNGRKWDNKRILAVALDMEIGRAHV